MTRSERENAPHVPPTKLSEPLPHSPAASPLESVSFRLDPAAPAAPAQNTATQAIPMAAIGLKYSDEPAPGPIRQLTKHLTRTLSETEGRLVLLESTTAGAGISFFLTLGLRTIGAEPSVPSTILIAAGGLIGFAAGALRSRHQR